MKIREFKEVPMPDAPERGFADGWINYILWGHTKGFGYALQAPQDDLQDAEDAIDDTKVERDEYD